MRKTPLQLRQTVFFCALAFAAMETAYSQANLLVLPTGGTVNAGSASITQNGNAMRIQQNTQQAIIDWASYNIGKNASVQYVQPNASASILNRVANGRSDIAGSLSSNGQVFLLNPNGVLFSASAQVNVGSLVAAAGTASNASFLAGALQINSNGKVINQAELNSAVGGSIVLAGSQVQNEGKINAPQGAISLVAGDTVRLNLTSDGLIQAQVTLATPQAVVGNSGVLQSDDGNISLSASEAAGGSGGLVVNSGIIRASGITRNGGLISLTGGDVQMSGKLDASAKNSDGGTVKVFGDMHKGTVQFDGSIDASAGGAGKGGFIETSAAHVNIASMAKVNTLSAQGKTGTWLIDPQDFTIGSANGDDISGLTLSNNLGTSNVSIQSSAGTRAGNGDIFINDTVDWDANTTLSLDAVRDLQFHAGIMARGDTAGIVLKYANNGAGPTGDVYLNGNTIGLSGSAPSISANGKNFTVINQLGVEGDTSSTTLQGMKNNLTGAYVLGSDIDATSTSSWNGGLGFAPIGGTFSGVFSGLNHTILNLSINRPAVGNIGLFGILTGEVNDLNLSNANLVGRNSVGAVVGSLRTTAQIKGVTATGSIRGQTAIGGIIGSANIGDTGLIEGIGFSGSVNGETGLGGLVGNLFFTANDPVLRTVNFKNSYYDLDAVLINGEGKLTEGALYHGQYLDWLAGGKNLNIANYSDNLPIDSNSGYYLVNSVQGLKDMLGFSTNPNYKFRLTANLDLINQPGLYLPIFAGEFDGGNHEIANLSLAAIGSGGMFGTNTGTIKNLGILNATVAADGAGALAGFNFGVIENTQTSGTVSGQSSSGGLVGALLVTGSIANSLSTVNVTGPSQAGGLVGDFDSGSISNSHYNIDSVNINGAHSVTAGGVYQAQYLDWLNNNKALNINNYTSSLPFSAANGGYQVSTLRGFKDMLGFIDVASNKFVLGANIDMAPAPGLYIPYLVGQLDGAGHTISNLSLPSPDKQYLGLVGVNYGTIRNIGVENVNIEGFYALGGLVGRNMSGALVESSYSTGSVQTDTGGLGGLVGDNRGDVRSSYSSATVVGSRGGGLVGFNQGTIDTSFSNGAVTAANGSGLVGSGSTSQVTNSFWDTQLSGKSTSAGGGTGKTTAEMKQVSTFSGWDFFNTWRSVETSNVPVLRSLTQGAYNLTVTANDASIVYGDALPAASSLNSNVTGFQNGDTLSSISGSLAYGGTWLNAVNAGSYSIAPNGLSSTKYDLIYVNGSLTVEIGVMPVPSKSVDVIVVDVAAPKSVEATSAVATVGPVVSTQRKALFAPANDAITNNPQIANLKECEDDKYTDCIAKPRKAIAQIQIGDEASAALPTILVKRKLALVIGNNQYPSPLSSLQGAGSDAKALAGLLQEQGYEVNSLADAGRSEMIAGMNKLIRESNADDSVFVFYAGHGHIHPGSSVGYWIPTDAHFDDPRGWLSNIDIARFLANISSRQVLLVSDSCFSGALTREAGGDNTATSLGRNSILSRRSVVAMSSGGEEVVEDVALEGHSPFTYHLLKQLKENKGEIHARTILNNVREKVMQTQAQEPAYGTIVSSGHTKGGEYILNALKE